jgi:uncharacterized protein (TIGR00297 family)
VGDFHRAHIWCLPAWFGTCGVTYFPSRQHITFDMSYLAYIKEMSSAVAEHKIWIFAAASLLFAVFGRLVRGVTTRGAITGAIVCFALLWGVGISGFAALLTVFVLTWLSTRIGYARKERLGTAEPRTGRNAFQVLANLGTAAGCAAIYSQFPNPWIFTAMAAALAEAAADTVSSELGQAMGGTPRLITTGQRAEPGTNGAITITGTVAGAIAAVTVAFVFVAFGVAGRFSFIVIAFSGIAGMIADSFLGATLEGHARIGNNAVNFISTLIAAAIAFFLAP